MIALISIHNFGNFLDINRMHAVLDISIMLRSYFDPITQYLPFSRLNSCVRHLEMAQVRPRQLKLRREIINIFFAIDTMRNTTLTIG